MGFLSFVAAAVSTAAVVAPLVAPAAAKSASTTSIPVHTILSSPGGVLTLPDGRQLKAEVHAIGECITDAVRPTGAARSSGSNFTMFRQQVGPPCVLADRSGTPTYVGFQAIRVTANGFKFSADLTLEDVDADTRNPGSDAEKGWRETMTALGLSSGALVRPDVSVEAGALVGVKDYAVDSLSLAQAGWKGVGSGDLPMQAVAYDSWTRVENIKDDNAELARGFVSFNEAIDDLMVMYALTQPDAVDATKPTAAFMSAIDVADGCQCTTKAAEARKVALPVAGSPGRCVIKTRSVSASVCDFRGNQWCETLAQQSYVQTSAAAGDGTVGCEARPSTIHKVVSSYSPVANFGTTIKQ